MCSVTRKKTADGVACDAATSVSQRRGAV